MSEISEPPWSSTQLKNLNDYQDSGFMHPFTCPRHTSVSLKAYEGGWLCRKCGYSQFWAHDWMADGSWRETRIIFGGDE